jgi:Regulator of ribonuclease activity B
MLGISLTRRGSLVTSALFVALPSAFLATVARAENRIRIEQLEQMFANIRSKTKWNIDGPMLWGYFFFDDSREKLLAAAMELGANGYRVMGVSQVEGEARYRLHVERVEEHSPTTLHARNNALAAFAAKHRLASYDGMDAGPAP